MIEPATLLHLTMSLIGMYVAYRYGYRLGVRAGFTSYSSLLQGILNASVSMRGNNTNTPSGGEGQQAGHGDSNKS